MKIRNATQKAIELLGAVALLSWFELYLEIVRYQHLVLTQIGSVVWPSEVAGSRPGGFLRSVVVSSILAPTICIVLWASTRTQMSRDIHNSIGPGAALLAPAFMMISGAALILLAAANQIIRRPPIVVDLTLRSGNGGFVILGLTLAIVGIVLRSRKIA